MKPQLLNRFGFLALLLLLMLPQRLSAEIVEIDGINYSLNEDNTASVIAKSPEYTGEIVIPSAVEYSGSTYSVTTIGSFAFDNCSGLTSVTIPNSVTSIGDSVFAGCWGLTSVEIPNSVTFIGSYAFVSCIGLTTVTIPASVTNIGHGAFGGCDNLESIYVDEENSMYKSISGVLFNKDITCLHSYPIGKKGEYIIPNSVTSIGDFAFDGCSGLTSVIIPNTVNTIGDSAFGACISMTSLTMPESVTSIGSMAFYCCDGLTSVTILSSVASIGSLAFDRCISLRKAEFASIEAMCKIIYHNSLSNPLYYAHNLWIDGKEIKDLVIPETVTAINGYAFYNCSGLTSVTIPNSVTSIGEGAFYGCRGLTSVTIPNSVTSISSGAFQICSGLTSVTIPNSVITISDGAFAGCSGLTSVTIPNSVITIDIQAFSFCDNLVNFHVDKDNKFYTSIGGVLYSKNISSLIIYPSGKIGDYVIPNTVTAIEANAFDGCSGLSSVTIPKSITYISPHAFEYCFDLKTMRIKGERVIDPQTDNNDCVFYVPASVIEQYRSQFPEKTFEVDMEDVHANFSLAAENFEIGLGDTAMLTLSLGKAEHINGFQTDISLPEGLSIEQNSRGKLNVTLGEGTALKSHSLVAQKVSGNNRYRILVYSTKSEPFTSGEGLLNIPVESDDSFTGGEIIIDSTELNFAADYTEKPGEVRIAANLLLYGDANDNGRVAIDDAVAEALYIMENDPQPFSFKKADVNRDGSISIADVMKTVGIALTNSAAAPAGNTVAAASASREGDIPMSLGEVSFTNGKAVLTISLGNVDDITAMQADLTLPEGVSVTDITFSDEQVDRDHFVDYRVLSPTHVRFAVFSLTLDTLEPDAQLVDVELSCTDSFAGGSIAISDIMLTDTKAKSQEYGKIEVTVPNPDIASDIATIGSGDRSGADVYNLQGILLMRDASPADIRTLPAGLYIINGQKVIIK